MTGMDVSRLRTEVQGMRAAAIPNYLDRVATCLRGDFTRLVQYRVETVQKAMKSGGGNWGAQILTAAKSDEALAKMPEIINTHDDCFTAAHWFIPKLFETGSGEGTVFAGNKELAFRKVLNALGPDRARLIVSSVPTSTIHTIALGLNCDSANYYFDMLEGHGIAAACVPAHAVMSNDDYQLSPQVKTILGIMSADNLAKAFPSVAGKLAVANIKHKSVVLTQEQFYDWASSRSRDPFASVLETSKDRLPLTVASIWGSDRFTADMAKDSSFDPPTTAEIFGLMLAFKKAEKAADILATFDPDRSANILETWGTAGAPAYIHLGYEKLRDTLPLLSPFVADDIMTALEEIDK